MKGMQRSRMISPDLFRGFSERGKVNQILKKDKHIDQQGERDFLNISF